KGSSFISKLMAPGGKFLASKVGKILPFLGPGIYLLSQLGGEKPLKEKLMRGGGGLGGMLLGAKLGGALGASAGSIIPFAGTAVGGILGATLGSSLGAFFGEGIGGKVYKNFFGEVEKSEPGSEKSPWRNERRINLDIPKSRTFEKIEGSGGVFKRDSQLEKLKKILGEKLAFEAAQVAATEGGIDKEGNLKTDAINKQSLAAGLFQFLPSVGVDTISRIDDKSIKEKFQKYIDELEKNKKLSSESREEVAKLIASLNEEEQATIYKKYIEPLAVAKGGYENLTAEDLKSYGLSPMAELTNSDDDMVVYKKGTPAYDQNPYLDLDKDGVITKGEIRSYSEKLMKNRTTAFNRFLRKNMENSVKMEVGSTENGWTVASLTQKPLSPSVSEEREEKREVIRPQPVLIASRRAIAPETSELAKEATTQSQQSSTPSPQPTTIVVDNRSVLTQRSNSSQRMEIATVRNTDPTIQKALEKSYFS
ncbi:MAG: hypothetical protein N3A54_05215, partial [Patescibacteria group bacterium]|nr:hypothetical protein [Patescibacteria group bacterium]